MKLFAKGTYTVLVKYSQLNPHVCPKMKLDFTSSNRANFCKFTSHCFVYSNMQYLTLFVFRIGRREAKNQLPTSFSAVTSTNVVMSPQNPLTFSFKSFASLV